MHACHTLSQTIFLGRVWIDELNIMTKAHNMEVVGRFWREHRSRCPYALHSEVWCMHARAYSLSHTHLLSLACARARSVYPPLSNSCIVSVSLELSLILLLSISRTHSLSRSLAFSSHLLRARSLSPALSPFHTPKYIYINTHAHMHMLMQS